MKRILNLFVLLVLVSLLIPPGLGMASPSSRSIIANILQNPQANSNSATSVAYSPDGKLLAIGGVDSHIYIYDVNSGQLQLTLDGHAGAPVTGVAFSPDGNLLASSGRDSVIRLWNPLTGQQVREFHGHENPARALAFNPDGSLLASG